MRIKNRRRFLRGGLGLVGLVALNGCGRLPWQPQSSVPRIGYLSSGTAASQVPNLEGFRQGLRELGYVESQTVTIEQRHADGDEAVLPALVAELLAVPVDVMVITGTTPAQAARSATATLPIVSVSGDPVAAGLVASLARPGGNVTALTVTVAGRVGKRLELLKQAVPTLARVAILGNAANAAHATGNAELQEAAPGLGVEPYSLAVRGGDEVAGVLEASIEDRPDGLLVQDDPLLFARQAEILSFAALRRLPAMYQRREWADLGGLMSYGVSFPDVYRRAATYVDKILKGANPAELPVEQPTTFDFVVNLKAAQGLGLDIPQSVLQQATRVIQ